LVGNTCRPRQSLHTWASLRTPEGQQVLRRDRLRLCSFTSPQPYSHRHDASHLGLGRAQVPRVRQTRTVEVLPRQPLGSIGTHTHISHSYYAALELSAHLRLSLFALVLFRFVLSLYIEQVMLVIYSNTFILYHSSITFIQQPLGRLILRPDVARP